MEVYELFAADRYDSLNQASRRLELWDISGYGLWEVLVKRGSKIKLVKYYNEILHCDELSKNSWMNDMIEHKPQKTAQVPLCVEKTPSRG